MRRRLTFLIGAHKTASTHLQRSLTAERAVLEAEGVGVIGPMPIGGDILPLADLLRGRADPDLLALAAEGFLRKHADDFRDVLLLNENILSNSLSPDVALKGDQLYRHAPGRVKRVLQLFPGHDIRVGLAVRNPASFLVSAWQEHIKGHPFQPFRHYLGDTKVPELGWLQLIKRLRQALGDTELFVWRYEDYPAVAPVVLRCCAGDAADPVGLKNGAANPGFSAAALDYLRAKGIVTKAATAEALKRYPKGPDHPPFQPWTPAEMDAMSERYESDLAQIGKQRLARVLRP